MRKKENIFLVFGIISLLLFVLLALNLNSSWVNSIDSIIYNQIILFKGPFLTGFLKFITNFGDVLFIAIILVLFIIFTKNKRMAFIMIINIVLFVVITQVLKLVFLRPRPADIAMVVENTYSFPSGHTTSAVCFYGLLMWFIKGFDIKRTIKNGVMILCGILITLICVSRIYLGAHFATDVIGSILLAFGYLIIFVRVVKKYSKSN